MHKLIALLAGLVACAEPPELKGGDPRGDQPRRVVSLDYCADQYVLKFVPRENIAAVSPDATATFSYMREAAEGVPTVRPLAEDVVLLKPDLVVRSYGGGPSAATLFQRAGVPVLHVGWATTLSEVMTNVQRMATALGADDKGRLVVDDMQARLSRPYAVHSSDALYMTPGGATTGPGSLVHELITAAGYTNFQRRPGWNPLPLERLAYDQPDRVVTAFFDTPDHSFHGWSAMRHPIAQKQRQGRPTTALSAAWVTCDGWFAMDAVDALRDGAP